MGAAIAALLAGTGAAQAADVMPIVVSVNPTDPVAVVGPTIEADLVAIISGTWYDPNDKYLNVDFYGDIDIKSASGWGIIAYGGGGANLIPGFGFGYGFGFEIYRAIGNFEVGFFLNPNSLSPLDIEFGPTLRYETDTVEIQAGVGFGIEPSAREIYAWTDVTFQASPNLEVRGFFDLDRYDDGVNPVEFDVGIYGGATLKLADGRYEIEGNIEFDYYNYEDPDLDLEAFFTLEVSERLKLYTFAFADVLYNVGFEVGGGAEFTLGAITPYVEIGWAGGLWAEAGFDVKKPIGTGGLQLIGGAEIWGDMGGFGGVSAYAGLRYVIGEDDDEY